MHFKDQSFKVFIGQLEKVYTALFAIIQDDITWVRNYSARDM